jgi:hypothetical protein
MSMALALRIVDIPGSFMHEVMALFFPRGHYRARTCEQPSSVIDTGLTESKDLELFDKLLLWEQGQLSEPDTLAFFQELVTSGLAWKSTGAVRRTAALLIRGGRIQANPDR